MITEANFNDPVTLHMGRDFTRLSVGQTVGDALEDIRRDPPTGRIIYFYVVDEAGRLQGVVPTRRLLLSPPEKPLAEIMVRQVISIPEAATVADACEFFVLHKLLAFPVVDGERRVIGTVDVDLYTEGLGELGEIERKDDLFQLIGVHVIEAQQTSPIASFRSRFPWLLCNIGGGILAAFLAGIYQAELEQLVALALFIPVVLALAEGVTIQSVSLSLQVMHGSPPTIAAILKRLRAEAGTGLLLGTASSLIVAGVALAWIGSRVLSICLLIGIATGVACAAVIGIALPSLLRLLNRDPQVAAGPIALAISDMITLLVYFNLARWLLE